MTEGLEKILDYVKQDTDKKFDDMQEQVRYINKQLTMINAKLDTVVAFKWKMVGIGVGAGFILSLSFKVIEILLHR